MRGSQCGHCSTRGDVCCFGHPAGKTAFTQTVLYSSRAPGDAVFKTRMEHGSALSYNRLAELLLSLGKFRDSRAGGNAGTK